MIQNYLNYFADCYNADNREFSIDNIFSSKFECQHIIRNEEELVNFKYPIKYIPSKVGQSIQQTIALFPNDKEVLYGSIFFVGKRRKNFQKRVEHIIAPLFYYVATIEVKEDENYFLRLHADKERKVNLGFIRSLSYATSFAEFYEALLEVMDKYPSTDFTFITAVIKLLNTHVENIGETEDLLLYPKLKTKTYLKDKAKEIEKEESFELVAASGIFVSSKANNINGVVNELNVLKKTSNYSTALRQFFSEEAEPKLDSRSRIKIPLLLSRAQERIVKNARHYNKSVIVGPPGTGKTYTISAIAQDYASQGKSVLIVTKTAQALDVIEDRLNEFKMGAFVIKVGGSYYFRRVQSQLRKISDGYYNNYKNLYQETITKYHRYDKRVQQIENKFKEKLVKDRERIAKSFEGSFFKRKWNDFQIRWWRDSEDREWQLIESYLDNLDLFELYADHYLYFSTIEKMMVQSEPHRLEIMKLKNAFEVREKHIKSKALNEIDAQVLPKILPIWLLKIDEASQALPFSKEMFDVVIVDEATQCDISSCLPIMQRAKKLVVAGDPNQLRHISFLANSRMETFQKKYNLELDVRFNYRKKSLLDFVIEHTPNAEQVVLLDEHYRSLPGIIHFSNNQFYDRELRIMQSTPQKKEKEAVFVTHVKGSHLKDGTNPLEALQIIERIKKMVNEQSDLTKEQASTVGVLSPFRRQTNHLTQLVKENFTLKEIKRHKMRMGTPYHFQGEERDVMFISMAIDDHSHSASKNHLNKADVFNVAITRARHKQFVYISASTSSLRSESLIRKYIETFDLAHTNKTKEMLVHDQFSKEVAMALENIGCTVHLGYDIAGLTVDLLAEYEGRYLGIDLIGYPGDFEAAFSFERYKIMNRVGVEIMPLSYVSWKYQQQEVLHKLHRKLTRIVKID